MPTKLCPVCGKAIGHGRKPSYIAERTYCSPACRNKVINPKPFKPRPTRSCECCGVEFVSKSGFGYASKQRFCSPVCRNKARMKDDKTLCPICGTAFKSMLYGSRGRKIYCSQECRRDGIRAKDGARLKVTQEQRDLILSLYPIHGCDAVAEMLGLDRDYIQRFVNKRHVRLTSEATQRLVYDKSREAMKENNPMARSDVREKVRRHWLDRPDKLEQSLARLTAGQQRLQKTRPSGLEQRLRNLLDDLGVEYEGSAMIKANFIVDIRIGRLIIEADGDWWHGHPRFEPLSERQLAQQRRDVSRNKYLSTCGYAVVRIWERDLCMDLVRRVLRENGVLSG